MGILTTKTGTSDKTERMKRDLINPKSLTPLNLLIDSKLHKDFKVKTATDGIKMTDVIVEAIKKYLA
jgi:hypothetical protein